MPIYIANCTKQNLRHFIRQPESGRLVVVEVGSGRQTKLEGTWSGASLDIVIEGLERFGFVNVKDFSGKMANFDGYLYSTEKPITEESIVEAHEKLVDKQELRSAQEATRAALGYERGTRDKKGKRLASITEVEIVQDIPVREKPTGKEVKMKLTVAPDGDTKSNIPV